MAKRVPEKGGDDALQTAMAEALAAVERAEKHRQSDEDEDIEVVAQAPVAEAEPDTETDTSAAATAELREQLLRLAADFENFRKRATRQMEEARQFGAERLILDLLPVVDNLERALSHAEGDTSPMVEGVRMVVKQFLDQLATHGVQGFDSRGTTFDPERHEAVGQAPAGDQPPGTILEEMLKGYFLHDRLLRPAQVIVAGAPAPDRPEE